MDSTEFDSFEENSSSELEKRFDAAAARMTGLASKLNNSDLLKAYGLYKQSTEGPCDIPAPKWYDMKAKQKWEAWKALENMPSDIAKENYVSLICSFDPSLKIGDGGGESETKRWVRVSTLQSLESEENEEIKTAFDICKVGNLDKLREAIELQPEILNELDEDGLGLIHWAADRGHEKIISLLLQMKCDVDLKDSCGQTALHYAASCGHLDCINVLLAGDADKSSKDEDGCTAADLASELAIKQLLLL